MKSAFWNFFEKVEACSEEVSCLERNCLRNYNHFAVVVADKVEGIVDIVVGIVIYYFVGRHSRLVLSKLEREMEVEMNWKNSIHCYYLMSLQEMHIFSFHPSL